MRAMASGSLRCNMDRVNKVPVQNQTRPMAETHSDKRPLSPHLQIYRPMLTMMMSIVHRITGAGLYLGIILLIWWLLAAAISADYFATVQAFFGHPIGKLILFGYTWALLHHMLGGIRHLIWDAGRGFSPQEREGLSLATIVGSVSLTVLLWVVGYLVMGGPR
jgi:succinate dehydrogenase / fumarate reductase cytochrome b subunit